MPIYTLDDVPKTTSWIQKLSATQAAEQCKAWSIQPALLLEENRVLLKNFVRFKADGKNLEENPIQSEEEDKTKSTTTPPDTEQTDSTTANIPIANQANATELQNNSTLHQDSTTPQLNSAQQSILTDPNVSQLIQSIHSITMNAVSETAKMVAKELKHSTASTSVDETKLPSFVAEMIKDLPKLTGNNPDQTINFLKKVNKLIELKIVPERTILWNVGPYVQIRMREFWLSNIANQVQWDQLLANLRQTFFTPDILREMQTRFLYRPQNNHEELSDYVKDIQQCFRILSPQTSESEIFNTVFRGINSETRITFAGLPPLTKIQDLVDIAPLCASLKNWPQSSQSGNQREQSSSPFSNKYYTPNTYPAHHQRPQNNQQTNQNPFRS